MSHFGLQAISNANEMFLSEKLLDSEILAGLAIAVIMDGTRVVQKLITTVDYRKQIAMLRSTIRSGFLALIQDLNGNHVIQRCLQNTLAVKIMSEYMEDRSTIGHPVAMQRFYADTNILWSYGNFVDIKGPTVMKIMTIEAIGGEMAKSIKELKKENQFLKSKSEKSDVTLRVS
ncbi:hypothetical protein JHK82_049939 [Glycine max]|nr:hypothetical protein JHK86_049815 [Glycine max]KAG5091161.1 hypothetical protein JHK82_049939 [Glycine max]